MAVDPPLPAPRQPAQLMLTTLFEHDPHLAGRTIAEARVLVARLEDIEKRLGTNEEKPGDLGLARETARRLRNRQVLLLVIKDHLHSTDPDIKYLCEIVPSRFEVPQASRA